jgi:hypothetical protein
MLSPGCCCPACCPTAGDSLCLTLYRVRGETVLGVEAVIGLASDGLNSWSGRGVIPDSWWCGSGPAANQAKRFRDADVSLACSPTAGGGGDWVLEATPHGGGVPAGIFQLTGGTVQCEPTFLLTMPFAQGGILCDLFGPEEDDTIGLVAVVTNGACANGLSDELLACGGAGPFWLGWTGSSLVGAEGYAFLTNPHGFGPGDPDPGFASSARGLFADLRYISGCRYEFVPSFNTVLGSCGPLLSIDGADHRIDFADDNGLPAWAKWSGPASPSLTEANRYFWSGTSGNVTAFVTDGAVLRAPTAADYLDFRSLVAAPNQGPCPSYPFKLALTLQSSHPSVNGKVGFMIDHVRGVQAGFVPVMKPSYGGVVPLPLISASVLVSALRWDESGQLSFRAVFGGDASGLDCFFALQALLQFPPAGGNLATPACPPAFTASSPVMLLDVPPEFVGHLGAGPIDVVVHASV